MSISPTMESTETAKYYTYNVGGDRFTFARDTIENLGENFLSCTVQSFYKRQEEYFIDVDPRIFREWIAPYIRHRLLPDEKSIPNEYEKSHIIAVAEIIGMLPIVESLKKKEVVEEPLEAFGAKDWETFYGPVADAAPLPDNIEEILNGDCPFLPEKKVRDTHLAVLIPNKIDGMQVSLGMLPGLRNQRGVPVKIYTNCDLPQPEQIKKSYWVLMPTWHRFLAFNLLNNYQDDYISEKFKKVESYRNSTMIEVALFNVAAYLRFGASRWYDDYPLEKYRVESRLESRKNVDNKEDYYEIEIKRDFRADRYAYDMILPVRDLAPG